MDSNPMKVPEENLNTKEYFLSLADSFKDKFKNKKINVSLYDQHCNKYTIRENDLPKENTEYIVVAFRSRPPVSTNSTPYYVNTVEELINTLDFICCNADLYETTASDDVYNSTKVIPLDDSEI